MKKIKNEKKIFKKYIRYIYKSFLKMSEGQNRQINKMKQQYMELKQKVYIIRNKKLIKY